MVKRSLSVLSSSWRVRLVVSPRRRSGFVGVALLAPGSFSCVVIFTVVTCVGAGRFLCSKLGVSWVIGQISCLAVVHSGGGVPFRSHRSIWALG